ncbi:zinc finger and BTB domain-containing protein 21 isoform X1 [Brienomyrus brachyistius]|uniref:zinc finger and BTB domain-containing protein 21 isoform X1 n=2 Tax=Brienomyrus brachyistius TaxID=42636 RepID=UPI0020B36A5B|nr:zinc finger and BTB domain-containing protein 21 isoform X1 [Brienomyrus brachyistius]
MTSNTKWMESRRPHARCNSNIGARCRLSRAPKRSRKATMESLVHYINPAHAISLLGVLNEQRLKGQLCDVILIVGDQKYEAHKNVLAASSEYFQSLFSRNNSEAQTMVQLDFCEPEAFENVLNYVYSSSLFVDKGSLAAIQELGYSLGIPFLTNIMSTRPQVSYSISRKRTSFSEEDDNRYQKRSVIVCQSSSNQPTSSSSHFKGLNRNGKPASVQAPLVTHEHGLSARGLCKSSEYDRPRDALRKTTSSHRSSIETTGSQDNRSSAPDTFVRGKAVDLVSTRPQLTSSVSLSESQIQHSSVQAGTVIAKEEPVTPLYNPKQPFTGQISESSQTVDRSGPLIKSLLRRSLSMDSPVPVFSPALELSKEQSRVQSVVKMASQKTTDTDLTEQRHQNSTATAPLSSTSRNYYKYDEEDVHKTEVHVKTEPSSPLADPSDIIRITVGDSLPVNFKDFNFDEGPKGFFKHSGKRKARLESRRNQLKKSRGGSESDFATSDNAQTTSPHNSDLNDESELGQSRQSKMFKCWNCLKVFRSNAGLYRHVNMYHNPEKPYSCGICHKRFHTNFKVWTHCQTQHGIMQNPAPSSSSYTVLDEKFQRKLIDIVREREIKKALIMKLRRNKQGTLQSQSFNKRGLRTWSKSYMCPYCGKFFLFQSQFKQHLKMHPCEKMDSQTEREDALTQKEDEVAHLKEKNKDVYPCRLCNEKLSSLFEQGDHERGCRHATVCPYCGLRFSSPVVKMEHETHCEYKKLTCLECMRTFKSSFSIWRHQVEVHNQNIMNVKEQLTLGVQDGGSKVSDLIGVGASKEDVTFSDSSGPAMFDSEESSFMPEDLSASQEPGELRVKEEPEEEAVDERARRVSVEMPVEESGVWPCEKCGKLFSAHKQLERHQELLCHIKPFICHICNKAFRTNFRLWSHFQSHMTAPEEPPTRECADRRMSSPCPSPPPSLPVAGPAAPQAESPKPASPGAEPATSAHSVSQIPEQNKKDGSVPPMGDTADKPLTPQESDTLFYHAPTLSALTFKRQYMCKLCHRTFKTAFSLWSHEQSHTNP